MLYVFAVLSFLCPRIYSFRCETFEVSGADCTRCTFWPFAEFNLVVWHRMLSFVDLLLLKPPDTLVLRSSSPSSSLRQLPQPGAPSWISHQLSSAMAGSSPATGFPLLPPGALNPASRVLSFATTGFPYVDHVF